MGKQITKLQLEAVVNTVVGNLKKQDEETLKSYKENSKKNKNYKEFCTIFENIKNMEKERENLEKKLTEERKKVFSLGSKKSSFYEYDFRSEYFKRRETEFLEFNFKESLKMSSFDSDKLRNELLIASIDPEFNIQAFIDKYSV